MNQALTIALTQALASNNPVATTEAAIASLPRSVSSRLKSETRITYPNNGEAEFTFVSYSLLPGVPSQDLSTSAETIRATMAPLSSMEILKLLTEMHLLTKQRDAGSVDLKAMLKLYAAKLAPYPGDIVRYAVEGWPSGETFWPSWNELYARLERYLDRRRGLLAALDKAIADANREL